MIDIPESFAFTKEFSEGERGRTWIAALPGLVADLLQHWSCTPDGPVMHGQVGIVVPVRHRDLPPAVIKVSFPHPGNVHEPDAFAAWNGRGAAQLFERCDDRFAMLLERAHYRTLASVTDHEEALGIQGRLSHRLSIEAPPGLPRLSDRRGEWEDEMLAAAAAFDHPLPAHVLDAALATLRELGPDQPNTLIHGDLHDANILASEREPWLAIDPKGYVGDPAHNALNVIRSPRFAALLGSPNLKPEVLRLLGIYCDAAQLDPVHTRRWTQARTVREALLGRRQGDPTWLIHATDQLAEALT
ncbi:aminoglycoside phosphotransferase family protein [Nocardia sp. NBC_01327]|uniref:aminoglycoside phosphotransferase family protein n=1 Tax=Nocardia sp. NBC_01327 TaxID=2903593 RepID=UPI002E14A4A0|nr:aminoglycoside phosphotransferase family protein [Nocardia sp. NBC_01327]